MNDDDPLIGGLRHSVAVTIDTKTPKSSLLEPGIKIMYNINFVQSCLVILVGR